MGYIVGNDPVVLVRLSVNRRERKLAEKELLLLDSTIKQIEENFYLDLFSDTPHTYHDIFHWYEDLFSDFVESVKGKVGKFYSVNPNYFVNNFKPEEKCH